MVQNCLGTCMVACRPLGSSLPGQQIPWGLLLLLQKSVLGWLKINLSFLPVERKVLILRKVKRLESLEPSCDILFFWDFTVSRDMISPQHILNLHNKWYFMVSIIYFHCLEQGKISYFTILTFKGISETVTVSQCPCRKRSDIHAPKGQPCSCPEQLLSLAPSPPRPVAFSE